jgi:hypothetical protein
MINLLNIRKYFYLIIVVLYIFSTCSPNKKDTNNTDIKYDEIDNSTQKKDSLLITYFCGMIQTGVAIRCEDLQEIQEKHPKNNYSYVIPEELIDAYIKDESVLDEMVLERMPVELIDTFIIDSAIINKIVKLLDNGVRIADFSEDARMYVTVTKSDGNNNYLCFDNFPNQVKYNGQAYSMDKELLFLLRYYSGYYSWFDISSLDRFEELQDTILYRKVLKQIQANEFNMHKK